MKEGGGDGIGGVIVVGAPPWPMSLLVKRFSSKNRQEFEKKIPSLNNKGFRSWLDHLKNASFPTVSNFIRSHKVHGKEHT